MKTYFSSISIAFAILILWAVTSHAQPGRWSDPVNISNTPGGSSSPAIAIGPDGYIHAVWEDDSRLGNPFMNDILYTYFNGYRWSDPAQLSTFDTTFSFSPSMAVDASGYPHVVWNHRAIYPDADIYYTTLVDTGWTEPLNLTVSGGTCYAPDIVIDSQGFINVVWADYYLGNGEIVYSYFDGQEWSDPQNVSNDPVDSGMPRLEVDSEDHLHLVWANYAGAGTQSEVYYSFYDAISWISGINISQNDSLPSIRPDIALDSYDHPHIVWNQITQWGPLPVIEEIYYRYFDGNSWSPVENITNLGLRTADSPDIAITSQDAKWVLFCLSSEPGDPYVNYTYCIDSQWTYPDSVFSEEYCGSISSLGMDNNDILHACISTGFNYVSNIGYTCYEYYNSITPAKRSDSAAYPIVQNYPNPFNQSTRICFSILMPGELNLEIYNIYGQRVKELEKGFLSPGEHEIIWNGTNQFGKEVSGGIYLIRLYMNGISINQRLTLVK